VKGCDLHGALNVFEGGTLLLTDSRVHHAAEAGVDVGGIADIQDCIVEDGQRNGIQKLATGKATISGTKVHHNGSNSAIAVGEALIKDSGVTANGRSGILGWTMNDGVRPFSRSGRTSSAAATTRATTRPTPTTALTRAARSRSCRTSESSPFDGENIRVNSFI